MKSKAKKSDDEKRVSPKKLKLTVPEPDAFSSSSDELIFTESLSDHPLNLLTPMTKPDQAMLKLLNKKGYSPGLPARIYCDGIFDLFHYGHAKALEQAKKLRPYVYLLVGVCNDHLTHSKKGKTVFTEKERYESLRHCKWVDEVIEDAPWIIDQEFLDLHRIDFVAHDDIPYKSDGVSDVYEFVKIQGRFLATQRTEGVSTSELITRIVRDYDGYLRRNLERGVSAKELNISFFKENEIKMKRSISELRGKITNTLKASEGVVKQNWMGSKAELVKTLDYWESKSQEWIKDFTRLFDANGPLAKMFRRKHAFDDILGKLETSSCEADPSNSPRSPIEPLSEEY